MIVKLKINNNVTGQNVPIRISDSHPIFTWEIEDISVLSVNKDDGTFERVPRFFQKSYEIRVSNSDAYLGTDAFIGSLSRFYLNNTQEMYWKYSGFPINRGSVYYGQIRIVDNFERISNWLTFSFSYEERPIISNVRILPYSPFMGDDITVVFDEKAGENRDVFVKWYKNGEYSPEFDNFLKISSDNLKKDDTLMARIIIYDGYEYSETYFTNKVAIRDKEIIVTDIRISPENPNCDDILKVDYNIEDDKYSDGVSIRWYINDTLNSTYNNKKFIRPSCRVGDSIRVSVSPIGIYDYKSSDYVHISKKDFIVKDILVDGRLNPLDVSTITPNISWKVVPPKDVKTKYVSIKIGTFYMADNVYSKIFNYGISSFTVPYNIMEKGKDYFISISASDTEDFDNYSYARIRIIGSRWELNVSNSVGWTLETFFDIKGSDLQESNDDKIHSFKIYDGSNFAEISLCEDIENGNKISLTSGDVIHYNIGNNKYGLLTVAGKENDIKIYFNRELIIDGSGIFDQTTETKRLEIGCFNNSKLQINYKHFVYTTQGYFLPGESLEYSNLQFHTFIEFDNSSIVALRGYLEGKKIFAVNPYDKNRSSYIYTLLSDSHRKYGTTSKSFSSIYKIRKSLNGKYISAGYSKGLINMENYFIGKYDNEVLFMDNKGIITNQNPEEKGWEIVSDDMNVSDSYCYYNEYGFNIDTIGN